MFRLKLLRMKKNLKQSELAHTLGVAQSTLSGWENGKFEIDDNNKMKIADYFGVSVDYLLGRDNNPHPRDIDLFQTEEIAIFEVVGSVTAGYDGLAIEEPDGETIPIPISFLHGRKKEEFFTLRIKGDSMYPRLLEGDIVLVQRTTTVDSGDIAVILYNGSEATVKKVIYNYGENWLEMVPFNPENNKKRIEGQDLEQCRVLGKVVKLIRDI